MKKLILPFTLLVLVISFFVSCEKDSILHDHQSVSSKPDDQFLEKLKFPVDYRNALSNSISERDSSYPLPYPTLELLYSVAFQLQQANYQYDFIDSMIAGFGYPLWNYSIMKGSYDDNFIITIPFDNMEEDSVITGLLKYYFSEEGGEFRFFGRFELDTLSQFSLDSFDTRFVSGVIADFLIIEYNLSGRIGYDLVTVLDSVNNITSNQILPRGYWICIYKEVTDLISTLNDWFASTGDQFVYHLVESYTTSTHWELVDCWYVGDFTNAWFGSDLPDFNDYIDIFWGFSGGSGSNPGNPGFNGNNTPSFLEICMRNNLALSVANEYARETLVDACDLDGDIDALVDNALMASCDLVANTGETPSSFNRRQLREFNAVLASQNLIDPNILNQVTIDGNTLPWMELENYCDEEYIADCDNCSVGESEVLFYADYKAKAKLKCAVELLASYDGSAPVEVKDALELYFDTDKKNLAKFISQLYIYIYKNSEDANYHKQPTGEGFCGNGIAAWTYPVIHFSDIRLCDPVFFNQSANGRAVTLIHEWMHLYYFAGDVLYDWELGFTDLTTIEALFNADSFSGLVNELCP